MRILVVEDERQWREALASMYAAVVGAKGCDVQTASGAFEAIDKLRDAKRSGHPYDILSLDVNLSSGLTEAGYEERGAWGLDVLDTAADEKLVTGVVLVTAAAWDERFSELARQSGDADLRPEELGKILKSRFPAPFSVYLPKANNVIVAEHVESWTVPSRRKRQTIAPEITREVLMAMATSGVAPPYELEILQVVIHDGGQLNSATVRVRSQHNRQHFVEFDERTAKFLFLLALAKQMARALLPNQELLQYMRCGGDFGFTEEIDDRDVLKDGPGRIQRTLTNRGIQHDRLFTAAKGYGRQLAADVKLQWSAAASRIVRPMPGPYVVRWPLFPDEKGLVVQILAGRRLRRFEGGDAWVIKGLAERAFASKPPATAADVAAWVSSDRPSSNVATIVKRAMAALAWRLVAHPEPINPDEILGGNATSGWWLVAEQRQRDVPERAGRDHLDHDIVTGVSDSQRYGNQRTVERHDDFE